MRVYTYSKELVWSHLTISEDSLSQQVWRMVPPQGTPTPPPPLIGMLAGECHCTLYKCAYIRNILQCRLCIWQRLRYGVTKFSNFPLFLTYLAFRFTYRQDFAGLGIRSSVLREIARFLWVFCFWKRAFCLWKRANRSRRSYVMNNLSKLLTVALL